MLPRNVTYALRTLKHNPAFAAVAIATLAIGIGANTAMFSIVNGVLLRQLPYPNATRMVALNTVFTHEGRTTARLTGPDLVDLRAGAQVFDHVSYYYGGEVGVQLRDHAEFVGSSWASPDFFTVFGISPSFGRLFQIEDTKRSAVVALPFAARNFGSGPGALGKSIHIEGQSYEIIGVVPAGFHFPDQSQVWVAVPDAPEGTWSERSAFNYHAVATLRPGMSLDNANAQLRTIGTRLEATYPQSNKGRSFAVISLRDQLVGSSRTTLYFLMGAVSLLLLIACANVANLMLARATARSREMAVRAALGATRGAIIRQLLVESAVVALGGGVLGVLIAFAGIRLITGGAVEQIGLPRVGDIGVSWAVLAFAIAASLAASILFGLSPAWQASKVDFNETLKAGGRGVAGGSSRLRSALVVSQIALSFVLAISAGLLFRSFIALTNVDLGFRTDSTLVMYAHYPARTLDEYRAAGRFFETTVAELRQMPGAKSVSAAMGLPAGQYGSNGNYVVDGESFKSRLTNAPHADFSLAGPGYFSTMAIPLLRGRDFTNGDRYDSPYVAIISESLARQSFRGQDPLGHTIQCGLDGPPRWMTIVGVVADVRRDSPASAPGPLLYMPLLQHPYYGNEVQVAIRTATDATSLIAPVRQKMLALNPEVATKFTTMEAMVSDTLATPRFRMFLVITFAMIALLLAVTGMYGVMSYVTSQRIPEFGVRMALGASPHQVVLLVLRRAAALAAVGSVIGIVLAAACSKAISSMLFGLKASDLTTYSVVLLALTPIVIFAAAIPAWRASRVDPLAALRQE